MTDTPKPPAKTTTAPPSAKADPAAPATPPATVPPATVPPASVVPPATATPASQSASPPTPAPSPTPVPTPAAGLKARVTISLKPGVLDPQGRAIGAALGHMGFAGVGGVRQGKVIELDLAETDRDAALATVEAMCRKLLANTVIETYAIELSS